MSSADTMLKCAEFEEASFISSDFMKMIHTTGKRDKFEDIPVSSMIVRCPWMSNQWATIEQSAVQTNDGVEDERTVTYRPAHELDYLYKIVLSTTTPAISIRPDLVGKSRVRICWADNLFHNIIMSGESFFGSKKGPVLPQGWLDQRKAWYMNGGAGQEENYDGMIGDTKKSTSWSEYLAPMSLRSPQPWWFSASIKNAVPLMWCKKSNFRLTYNFNLNILRLLRVQIYEDKIQQWVDIIEDEDKMDLLANVDGKSMFPVPTMRGRYGQMDAQQRKLKDDGKYQAVLASSIIPMSTSDAVQEGSSKTFKLTTNTPIYAIYFAARHQKADKYSNFSNYTDNYMGYPEHGDHPIAKVIHYQNGTVKDRQDPADFARLQAWFYANSAPRQIGPGMYSLCEKPHALHPDAGMVFNDAINGQIKFKLKSARVDKTSKRCQQAGGAGIDLEEIIARNKERRKSSTGGSYHIYIYLLTRLIISYEIDRIVHIDDGSRYEKGE